MILVFSYICMGVPHAVEDADIGAGGNTLHGAE
jgi:hypothetical protein